MLVVFLVLLKGVFVMSNDTKKKDTKAVYSDRNVSIDHLLRSIYLLNNLNEVHLSKEESEEYGEMILYTSKTLIGSYVKSFEPDHFLNCCKKVENEPQDDEPTNLFKKCDLN